MTRYYDTLLEEQRGPFTVIVDKTWEDLNPRDLFDDCLDVEEIIKDIDRGHLEWFMLRTRVIFEGVELAAEYLGGCLYEEPKECLTDGMAEDQIYQALQNARKEFALLREKINKIDEKMVDEVCA